MPFIVPYWTRFCVLSSGLERVLRGSDILSPQVDFHLSTMMGGVIGRLHHQIPAAHLGTFYAVLLRQLRRSLLTQHALGIVKRVVQEDDDAGFGLAAGS